MPGTIKSSYYYHYCFGGLQFRALSTKLTHSLQITHTAGRSRDRDQPGQHGETPSLLKTQKISWAWWYTPVIPATQEAETGKLLEPGRWRLQ